VIWNNLMKRILAPGLVLGVFWLASLPATAAEYWLCAQSVNKMMPDSTMVPMWGFAMDDNGNLGDKCPGGSATVPGPKLTVPAGETTLTIHLRNDLTGSGIEPVSIVIPGQAMPTNSPPVVDGGRVRSFVQVAEISGGTETYTWNNLQPGTYLYESGTHPQVQVQMGLYGAVTKDSAVNNMAYPGVLYTEERDLFYSEVDPALHAAVANGDYGSPPWTSTLSYIPKYFLLHGDYDSVTHSWDDVSIDTGTVPPTCIDSGIGQGDRLLLRMYNAGLRELAPMLLGAHFDLVAEGGKKYPFARTQYQTLLMPGSTKDAVFTPEYEDDVKVIERRLNLTDAAATGGGMQTCIMVAGVNNNAPVVTIDAPTDGDSFNLGNSVDFMGTATDAEDDDTTLTAALSWTSSIDGSIGSGGSFSTSTLSVGVHTITASVTDSGGLPGSASISITIIDTANTAPTVTITAPDDGDTVDEGTEINFSGTANDAEDDDTTLTAALSWTSSIDGSIGSGGSFSTSTLSVGVHTITASVTDSGGLPGSDLITVTVNAVSNTAPVVTITNPSNGATFTQIDSIPFAGTASDDVEPGISGADLSWTSSIDGSIGSGASFSTTLTVGTHTIEASVTDQGGAGLVGSDAITVNIVAAAMDTLTCKKADYNIQNDRLSIEVSSNDLPKGNRTITGVIDINGDGFGGADDYDVGTIPVKNPGSEVYRIVIEPFPDPNPTEGTSVLRATSDLGGECTITVQ
jgi:hypothetical protein